VDPRDEDMSQLALHAGTNLSVQAL
jgi:hypothetical protein